MKRNQVKISPVSLECAFLLFSKAALVFWNRPWRHKRIYCVVVECFSSYFKLLIIYNVLYIILCITNYYYYHIIAISKNYSSFSGSQWNRHIEVTASSSVVHLGSYNIIYTYNIYIYIYIYIHTYIQQSVVLFIPLHIHYSNYWTQWNKLILRNWNWFSITTKYETTGK